MGRYSIVLPIQSLTNRGNSTVPPRLERRRLFYSGSNSVHTRTHYKQAIHSNRFLWTNGTRALRGIVRTYCTFMRPLQRGNQLFGVRFLFRASCILLRETIQCRRVSSTSCFLPTSEKPPHMPRPCYRKVRIGRARSYTKAHRLVHR